MAVEIGVPGVTDAEQIGQGGFGKVYKAHQAELNRDVAVKVLTNVDLDTDAHQRFVREARSIGRLSGHPNVVGVYAQGITRDGAPFLIMELCSGGSLGDRLRQGQRLSWQEATDIIIKIAGALHTAHEAGILHRDIKPANLLIDTYGTPKLADFGIARVGTEISMTQTGMMAGSPAHIAPELVAGNKPTAATDVYSLASTLFALITGRAPFVRETDTSLLALVQRITNEPAPHLSQWGVPAPIADLVVAALAKQPQQRPRTADEFARALMTARSQLGLPRGDYRVQRPAVESDLTMVPQGYPAPQGVGVPGVQASLPGSGAGSPAYPSSGSSATPQHGWTGPSPQAHQPPAAPVGLSAYADGPRPGRIPLIILCWAIVALCAALITWMLWDRAQHTALSGAPLLRMLLG